MSSPSDSWAGFGEYRRAQDSFHLALGYCIAKWSDVQDELFRACWVALRTSPEQTAVVFFRTPTLDARLSLTSELVKMILPKTKPGAQPNPDLKVWDDICAEFRSLMPVRNRLAHHPVKDTMFYYAIEAEQPGQISQIDLFTQFRTSVSEAEMLRGHHEQVKDLTEGDLARHITATAELATRLQAFVREQLMKRAAELPPPLIARPLG